MSNLTIDGLAVTASTSIPQSNIPYYFDPIRYCSENLRVPTGVILSTTYAYNLLTYYYDIDYPQANVVILPDNTGIELHGINFLNGTTVVDYTGSIFQDDNIIVKPIDNLGGFDNLLAFESIVSYAEFLISNPINAIETFITSTGEKQWILQVFDGVWKNVVAMIANKDTTQYFRYTFPTTVAFTKFRIVNKGSFYLKQNISDVLISSYDNYKSNSVRISRFHDFSDDYTFTLPAKPNIEGFIPFTDGVRINQQSLFNNRHIYQIKPGKSVNLKFITSKFVFSNNAVKSKSFITYHTFSANIKSVVETPRYTYVFTTDNKVYSSIDGITWTLIYTALTVINYSANVNGICYFATDKDLYKITSNTVILIKSFIETITSVGGSTNVYVGCGNDLFVFKTTWNKYTIGVPIYNICEGDMLAFSSGTKIYTLTLATLSDLTLRYIDVITVKKITYNGIFIVLTDKYLLKDFTHKILFPYALTDNLQAVWTDGVSTVTNTINDLNTLSVPVGVSNVNTVTLTATGYIHMFETAYYNFSYSTVNGVYFRVRDIVSNKFLETNTKDNLNLYLEKDKQYEIELKINYRGINDGFIRNNNFALTVNDYELLNTNLSSEYVTNTDDIILDILDNEFLSSTKIYTTDKIPYIDNFKKLFIQTKDEAGNISPVFNVEDLDNPAIFNDTVYLGGVEVASDAGSVYQIDANTLNIQDVYTSNAPLHSGSRNIFKTGEYVSQIIYIPSLTAWGNLDFLCDIPAGIANTPGLKQGTQIELYVKTANSKQELAAKDFGNPFKITSIDTVLSDNTAISSNYNISAFSGKYLQYKFVLTTANANITPELISAVLTYTNENSSYFFTTMIDTAQFTSTPDVNFQRGIIMANKLIPNGSSITIGYTHDIDNSFDFNNYTIIKENTTFEIADKSKIRFGFLFIGTNVSNPTLYDFGVNLSTGEEYVYLMTK